ncbi:MAG: hypothetical protein HQK53_08350 [Oligoflexia bacterium]|nr:hypothetical protein [Oligoflexia bacterium]
MEISAILGTNTLTEISLNKFIYFLISLFLGKVDFVSNYAALTIYSAIAQTLLFFCFYRFSMVITNSRWIAITGAILSLGYFGTNIFSFYRYYTFSKVWFPYLVYLETLLIFVCALKNQKTKEMLHVFPLGLFCLIVHPQEALLLSIQIILLPTILFIAFVFGRDKTSICSRYYRNAVIASALLVVISSLIYYFRLYNHFYFSALVAPPGNYQNPEYLFFLKEIFPKISGDWAIVNFGLNFPLFKTLGIFGVTSIILSLVFYFFPKLPNIEYKNTLFFTAVCLVPFIALFCPLTIFFLGKIMSSYLLYRLLYGSLYWLAFPAIVAYFAKVIYTLFPVKITIRLEKKWCRTFTMSVLITTVVISGVGLMSLLTRPPFWGRMDMLIYKSDIENNGKNLIPLIKHIKEDRSIANFKFCADDYTEFFLKMHGTNIYYGTRYQTVGVFFESTKMDGCPELKNPPPAKVVKNEKSILHAWEKNYGCQAIIVNYQTKNSLLGKISGHWNENSTQSISRYSCDVLNELFTTDNFTNVAVNSQIYIFFPKKV